MYNLGDFHFLWECLKVIFAIFWGTPSEVGSLCNMREFIGCKNVDKNVKVFNVGDELLLHAHLQARICSIFNITGIPGNRKPLDQLMDCVLLWNLL